LDKLGLALPGPHPEELGEVPVTCYYLNRHPFLSPEIGDTNTKMPFGIHLCLVIESRPNLEMFWSEIEMDFDIGSRLTAFVFD
jgi:hypothetical protein